MKTPGGVIEAKISPESNYAGIWVPERVHAGRARCGYGVRTCREDDGTPSIKLRVYKAEGSSWKSGCIPDGKGAVMRSESDFGYGIATTDLEMRPEAVARLVKKYGPADLRAEMENYDGGGDRIRREL